MKRFVFRINETTITAEGETEEDAKIEALTKISFNPADYLELEIE